MFEQLRQRAHMHAAMHAAAVQARKDLKRLEDAKDVEQDAPAVIAAIMAAGGNECFDLPDVTNATMRALPSFYHCKYINRQWTCCLVKHDDCEQIIEADCDDE